MVSFISMSMIPGTQSKKANGPEVCGGAHQTEALWGFKKGTQISIRILKTVSSEPSQGIMLNIYNQIQLLAKTLNDF